MFLGIFSCLLFETDFFVSFFFFKLTFLCLPDFIWNSYLLWPWRGVHVWGHPCQTVCTHWLWRGTAFDVGTVTSFLRVCWRLSPWWLVRLEMGELDLLRNEAGLRLCSVGITALSGVRLVPKLLERKPWMSDSSRCFPFNCVFFLLTLPWDFCLEERERWSQWHLCSYRGPISARVEVCGFIQMQPMIVSSPLLWLPQI